MKKPEKLDLLLKHLYEHCNDYDYHSLDKAIQNAGISLRGFETLASLAKKLKADGLIDFINIESVIKARITIEGLLFCEQTSYAYRGYPIITHILIERKTEA